ncbi:hypothetical protein C5167_003742 [Papaver somniferum]|uniref:Uncharacterized protein n=1 Tax=Papaver somniferum TaxID=3469 RepID=A0A4Y7L4E7_PAPSO|nr:hypothetical protein C5167_003742 [Papaver somniferum]
MALAGFVHLDAKQEAIYPTYIYFVAQSAPELSKEAAGKYIIPRLANCYANSWFYQISKGSHGDSNVAHPPSERSYVVYF